VRHIREAKGNHKIRRKESRLGREREAKIKLQETKNHTDKKEANKQAKYNKEIINWGLGGGGLLESLKTIKSVIPGGMALIPASAKRMRELTCA
jgi:hypothetical protein